MYWWNQCFKRHDESVNLIEKNTRVLDVGCGDGTLIQFLQNNKEIDIRGIEISKENSQKCVSKGLTVIEGDAEKDLSQFPDGSFDFVILSQTLQAFLSPETVIKELLRIGKNFPFSIFSFNGFLNNVDDTFSRNVTSTTYSVSLQKDIQEDVMLYASVATGFKSGGFNATGESPSEGFFREYEDEESTNFEIGINKEMLPSSSARTNPAWPNSF